VCRARAGAPCASASHRAQFAGSKRPNRPSVVQESECVSAPALVYANRGSVMSNRRDAVVLAENEQQFDFGAHVAVVDFVAFGALV